MKANWITVAILFIFYCSASIPVYGNSNDPEQKTYSYTVVEGDPLNARIYTLDNGLKVFLSRNDAEPRIMTNIAVRAGSKHDPADATGLAHYLEHMLFKGTSQMGALNWEKEKEYLDRISDLYELHRATDNEEKRLEIYRQIDSLSFLAAKMVGSNEYDRMISSLGARGTNAYTYVEQTVYVNDIPSNELEKWLKIESERFREVVLRLFHTELEAVYEEFNISQDSDFRKVNAKIMETLFPTHQYGTQTTIGTGEHLKNPSHVRIHEYFDAYYHPNNMAIVLAGDLEFDETIRLVDKHFGSYEQSPIEEFTFEPQRPLSTPVYIEVIGQSAEFFDIAYRLDADDFPMVELMKGILYNNKAGLIDLNLNQQQRVIDGNAWTWRLEDFTVFGMYAKPRQGQQLDEVKGLLLNELNKIKQGDFEEWLMEAVINDYRLRWIRSFDNNNARVGAMTNSFILGRSWEEFVNIHDQMAAITKEELVAFANENFGENYVGIYKLSGEDPNTYKVDKPQITPIELNRDEMSDFTKSFFELPPSEEITAEFIDYNEVIQRVQLYDNVPLDYMLNTTNDLFSLYYVVDMGTMHNRKISLALQYLPYLGTSKYSPDELQEELFRLGLSLNVNSGSDEIYVFLSGLDESFEEAVRLFEHLLSDVVANQEAFDNVVADVLTNRENNKKNRQAIMNQAMISYARFGPVSPFTDVIPEDELKTIKPNELVAMIKDITQYPHRLYYYGIRPISEVEQVVRQHKKEVKTFKPIPQRRNYPELSTNEDKVYFVHFPMVQAEVTMMSKSEGVFDYDDYIFSDLYNNYFGFGLSSIMFQEIRESQALAYSTFSFYSSPQRIDEAHYLRSFVGTQADKMQEAILAVRKIIDEMPLAPSQVDGARNSLKKRIESERLRGPSLYFGYYSNKRRGIEHDFRTDRYEMLSNFEIEDLESFQKEKIAGRNFTFLVLGDRERIDLEFLKTIGELKELSLEEVFGY